MTNCRETHHITSERHGVPSMDANSRLSRGNIYTIATFTSATIN